jgi:hypothetical protein
MAATGGVQNVAPVDTPMPERLNIDLEAAGWKNAVDEFLPLRTEQHG